MAKFDQLSELLSERIHRGDYVIRELPAERRLAAEHGVSYMTARRAVQQLIDNGLLTRAANGRLKVQQKGTLRPTAFQVAYLLPSFESPVFDRWSKILRNVIEAEDGNLRQIVYTHWDDPVIEEVLASFDGVFLLASTEPIPPAIRDSFRHSSSALIMLNEDLSHLGIPSIQLFPSVYVRSLMEHLGDLGCHNICCFNVQPNVPEVNERIRQWRLWMAEHQLTAPLINDPVEPYADQRAHAYNITQRLIVENQFNADAVLCITIAAAQGVMRALYEAGVSPGEEMPLCVVDGEGIAAFQIPSITALEAPDVSPFIRHCTQWMKGFSQDKEWRGPLLMQPSEVPLVIRESTHLKVMPAVPTGCN